MDLFAQKRFSDVQKRRSSILRKARGIIKKNCTNDIKLSANHKTNSSIESDSNFESIKIQQFHEAVSKAKEQSISINHELENLPIISRQLKVPYPNESNRFIKRSSLKLKPNESLDSIGGGDNADYLSEMYGKLHVNCSERISLVPRLCFPEEALITLKLVHDQCLYSFDMNPELEEFHLKS